MKEGIKVEQTDPRITLGCEECTKALKEYKETLPAGSLDIVAVDILIKANEGIINIIKKTMDNTDPQHPKMDSRIPGMIQRIKDKLKITII